MKRVGAQSFQRVVGRCETMADASLWPITSESEDRKRKQVDSFRIAA